MMVDILQARMAAQREVLDVTAGAGGSGAAEADSDGGSSIESRDGDGDDEVRHWDESDGDPVTPSSCGDNESLGELQDAACEASCDDDTGGESFSDEEVGGSDGEARAKARQEMPGICIDLTAVDDSAPCIDLTQDEEVQAGMAPDSSRTDATHVYAGAGQHHGRRGLHPTPPEPTEEQIFLQQLLEHWRTSSV